MGGAWRVPLTPAALLALCQGFSALLVAATAGDSPTPCQVTEGASVEARITTNSTFGQATGTLANSLGGLNALYQMGGPRSMQFALKLVF